MNGSDRRSAIKQVDKGSRSEQDRSDGGCDPVVFDLNGTALLSSGRTDEVVAASDHLVARVKVYASGGENSTHAHLEDEHLFLVLGGRAVFHLGSDGARTVQVGPNAGVLLPAGAFYRFESVGQENLVLLRVGKGRRGADDRIGPDGMPLPGSSTKNKHAPGVPIPGATFGAR
jgi:mannose-6-phosphate isomerase-like protein (cupin superfamily)